MEERLQTTMTSMEAALVRQRHAPTTVVELPRHIMMPMAIISGQAMEGNKIEMDISDDISIKVRSLSHLYDYRTNIKLNSI